MDQLQASQIKERSVDPVIPCVSILFSTRQGQSKEKRDPSHSTKSLRIVIPQARSDQRESTVSNHWIKERRDLTSPTCSFRAAFLKARSEQREKKFRRVEQGVSGFFFSRQGRSKERRDFQYHPIPPFQSHTFHSSLHILHPSHPIPPFSPKFYPYNLFPSLSSLTIYTYPFLPSYPSQNLSVRKSTKFCPLYLSYFFF